MTQIKLRRDTAANFTSKNPVLGVGEPAYETDTKKLKIGDGTTAYTQLDYFTSGGGGLEVKTATTADFNSPELLETGLYFISGGLNPQNAPVIYSVPAMLITMKWYSERSNQKIQQTWIGCDDIVGNQIYTRYSSCYGEMGSWTRVDSNKIASASALGSIKVGDGLAISSDGTLSASGGSTPTNMVTTDTAQTITGNKIFDNIVIPSSLLEKGIFCEGKTVPSIYQYEGSLYIMDVESIKTGQLKVVDSTSNGSITIGDFPEYGQVSQYIRFTSTRDTGGTIAIMGLQLNSTNTLSVGDSDFPLVIQGSTIKDNNNAEFVRLVESYTNGKSGYRVYSDGYCEQWDDNTGVPVESITFLKPYKDTNYTVLASSGYPDNLEVYNSFMPHEKTPTGFSINWTNTLRYNMWRTFGYVQI